MEAVEEDGDRPSPDPSVYNDATELCSSAARSSLRRQCPHWKTSSVDMVRGVIESMLSRLELKVRINSW